MSTRKFPDFVPKISFPVVFVFWTTFLSTFSVPLEVGCQWCVYSVMRNILMWRNLKKTIFSNLNSEESFFIISASIFLQCCLNCTLHFQRNISGLFFIEKKTFCFVISRLLAIDFEPFIRKTSGLVLKTAIGTSRVTSWGKTVFLRIINYLAFSHVEQKLLKFLAKSHRYGT